MFPTTFTDKTECLESLLGIKSACTASEQYPFYIEDIEGVDVKTLASVAKSSDPSGAETAKRLINTASRLMLADIENMMNEGFKLKDVVADLCSNCDILPSYIPNAGIIVNSGIATKYTVMTLTRLTVMANVTGERQLVIDDGILPKYYTISLQAGVQMPLNMNYQTKQKSFTIKFVDPTVPVGQVTCATASSCGCGSSGNGAAPVKFSGTIAGLASTIQYGFIACVSVGCSSETLVCNLIKQIPSVFGQALLSKFGELYYDNKRLSERNNTTVSYNDEEEVKLERNKNYAQLYKSTLQGTAKSAGLKQKVSAYLANNSKDICIECDNKFGIAYTTG